jgi:uncharacterized protein (TIGR02145 family)
MRKVFFKIIIKCLIIYSFVSCSEDNSSNPDDVIQTITIGNQVWMKKNLDVATYRNGDPIPQVANTDEWQNLTTGAWCYYANYSGNGITYGKLYNWYAVNDVRGLAPEGFHVPTDADWDILFTFLGGPLIAGGKMKEIGTEHWLAPNTGATNSNSFTALPGGMCNGGFNWVNRIGYWWSSTESIDNKAWYRVMYYNNEGASRGSDYKNYGFSVRCIKN